MQPIEAILLEPIGCLAETVASTNLYEDVRPALAELKTMGTKLVIATSLSRAEAMSFVERHSLGEFLAGIWTRDDSGEEKSAPLLAALAGASLSPERTIYLTDTAEGIKAARIAGIHPILMMNDPDEARRLTTHKPDGGVVSFHEIPDLLRLLVAQVGQPILAAAGYRAGPQNERNLKPTGLVDQT